MKNLDFTLKHSKALIACLALVAVAVPTMALRLTAAKATTTHTKEKATSVAYPWVFKKGNETSQGTAWKTVEGISRKAGYTAIPIEDAEAAWASSDLKEPAYGHLPSLAELAVFGKAAKASKVLYGSIAWHTRSVWVNAGPKTISTATVDAYVYDVETNKIVFKKTGVEGRSDDESNAYKLAADVILTPLVTAVSGGPATPREQRAVQIALGLAYHNWVRQSATK